MGRAGAGSCRPGDAFLFACVGYEHVEPRGQEAEIQTCSGSQVLKRRHLRDCALVTGQRAALRREGVHSRLFTSGLDCCNKPAFLQLSCGFSGTCRESRPCWTHVAELRPAGARCRSVPMAWVGSARGAGAQAYPAPLLAAVQPWAWPQLEPRKRAGGLGAGPCGRPRSPVSLGALSGCCFFL